MHVYSAKELLPGETNVAYICSRYYRAPELILGATDYTNQIGTLASCSCPSVCLSVCDAVHCG